MEILKRTPRTEMIRNALISKFADLLPRLSKELETPEGVVDQALWPYMNLCVRVRFETDEVDFDLTGASDTAEQAAKKFVKYLNSDCIERIEEARERIRALDRPTDIAIAPEAPEDPNS